MKLTFFEAFFIIFVMCGLVPDTEGKSMSEDMVIKPGVGALGVAEIGMCDKDLKKQVAEFTVVEINKYRYDDSVGVTNITKFVEFPQLGIMTKLNDAMQVDIVTVEVSPKKHQPSFSGQLSRVIAFQGAPVGRRAIETSFGPLRKIALVDYCDHMSKGEDFSWGP